MIELDIVHRSATNATYAADEFDFPKRAAIDDAQFRHSASVHFTFGKTLLVGGASMFVVLLGPGEFGSVDHALLLRPALIHTFEAPFDAAAGRANRLPIHLNENRIRVRRWQN